MRKTFAPALLAAALGVAVLGSPAFAESATVTVKPIITAAAQISGQLTVTITSVPQIAFTPSNPTVNCAGFPAGTVVSAVAVTGGDGNPIALGITDPGASFVLAATVPPTNVIVGPTGIAAALCPAAGAPAIVDLVKVTASQN